MDRLKKLSGFLRSKERTSIFVGNSLSNEEYEAIKDTLDLIAPNALVSVKEVDDFRTFLAEANDKGLKRGTLGQLYEADVAFVIDDNLDEDLPLISSMLRKRVREGDLKVIYSGSTPGLLDKGSTILLKTNAVELAPLFDSLSGTGLIQSASKFTGINEENIVLAKNTLAAAKRPITLVGPKVASSTTSSLALINLCIKLDECLYLPLYRGANTEGALRILGDLLTPAIDNMSTIKEGKTTQLLAIEPDQSTIELIRSVNGVIKCALLTSKAHGDINTDIVVPITGWHERYGHVTNLSGSILEQNKTVLPPKELNTLSGLLKILGEL